MAKLVRDRIPEIIRADGRQPVTRVLQPHEYLQALHAKLREEAEEVRAAGPSERLEELADVYEVLAALAAVEGHSMAEVERAAAEKRRLRGGFAERIWLES